MAVTPRAALQSAEDLVAFFARAAVMRSCAQVADDAGQVDEAARLRRLAVDAEATIAKVVGQLVGPLKRPLAKSPAPTRWPALPRS